MAAETRAADASVKGELLAHGERFAYFQAIRLLRLFDRNAGGEPREPRVRPKLGLDFPESDIDAIDALPDGRHRITANFFGLYGVASPLPTFYTEDLFDEEREGRHATREFLDIVHYAMYPLLFDAWSKYRLEQRVVEDGDATVLGRLYAFVGLDDADLRARLQPGSALLLRYAALLGQRPRSASGLRTMLADAWPEVRVGIECCVPQAVPIPDDQRCRLGVRGHQLGEGAWLGSEVDDYANQLRIRFSDVPHALFHQLLPGMPGHAQLRFLVRFYLIDPLLVEVEIALRADDPQPARLGGNAWSRVGLDTWLAPQPGDPVTRVKFRL
ncbi:type VI secretion system protein ImpH [Paraburkholderia caballeronis]|uniref:type VI secretion system baseplate subunit TssG n=1 Tax=Paraburkholderia caballeronis TaxID=416943 RepID=UPI001065B713|nr:type VI secretion system protein ImpH [Paraburkholderia caballeronis]